jgi:hypothetical protein
MEVVQSLRKISAKLLNCLLGQLLVLLDQLEKISASAILENNPEMVTSFIPIGEFQNMSVFEGVEHPDLVQHLLSSALFN